MSDDYGLLASSYQLISRLVFGNDLLEANRSFWNIEESCRVLIIGGGDGTAYRGISPLIRGEFWDLSPKMARLAAKNLASTSISVRTGSWPGEGEFDRIFLPFVLDTMTDSDIGTLLSQIKTALKPGGAVVVSDFFAPVYFSQRILQQLMISTFRIVVRHRRRDLPDFDRVFDPQIWKLGEEIVWRKGWIRARLYRLKGNSV